ncbi:MAG: ATP-binding protein [Treponema sp.]
MITRKIEKVILSEGTKYPVITIVGPRQSGKTTLCKKLFPKYKYINLEQLDIRRFASEDPRGFFKTYEPPVILDEIQNCPELLSQVQVLSDELNKDAQFIITGSQQLALSQAISQSLAGRTSIFTLLPFSIDELTSAKKSFTRDEYILQGGMPRLYEKKLNAESYYRDYIQTYLERDVRSILNIKNLQKFELFLTLLAGRTGQLLNLASLSGDVGVSSTTLSEWISVLESSHIIFKLTPWFGNIGKRLSKSPKIYFTDTGIPCSLLGITTVERLQKDSLRGSLFENLVILEALKKQYNSNKINSLHFLRTESGLEIDLINQQGEKLIPYEIKSSDSLVSEYFNSLEKCTTFIPHIDKKNGGLIYSGKDVESYKTWRAWNFKKVSKLF